MLGVSGDDLDTLKRFSDQLKLPFPLLSDRGGRVARSYGVGVNGASTRKTFVVSPSGKIADVIEGEEAIDPASALAACHHG